MEFVKIDSAAIVFSNCAIQKCNGDCNGAPDAVKNKNTSTKKS